MVYRKTSPKTLEELDAALREATTRHKFGVLGVHDLKQAMANKGVAFDAEVRVYEVCNPHHAKAVLLENMEISTALPCRISIYSGGGQMEVATVLPTELMKAFGSSPVMAATASEVEQAMKAIIDETV
ncbi:MAG TPA: DUF302 domain-containing protein [Paludibaculum sp.]|jgi:uncharacterized protein (DUF302 family)